MRSPKISIDKLGIKAKRLVSVLTSENQDHWLELAKTVSKQKLERVVAIANPKAAIRERTNYSLEEAPSEQVKIVSLEKNVRVQLPNAARIRNS